jgi:hypothetical protein
MAARSLARRVGRLEQAAQPLSPPPSCPVIIGCAPYEHGSSTRKFHFCRDQGNNEVAIEEAADLARALVCADEGVNFSLRDRIAEFDTPMLRRLREAMLILSGHSAHAAEPPLPPPPEPLQLAP